MSETRHAPDREQDRDQQDSHADRRKRYERVLQAVARKTSPRQLPGTRPFHLRTSLSGHGNLSGDEVDSAITAALSNEDLIAWRDAEGEIRLTLRTVPDLRRLLEHLDGELDAGPEALNRIKQAIREVRANE
jgi:hypothetical protein